MISAERRRSRRAVAPTSMEWALQLRRRMDTLQTILVPVDASPASLAALDHAVVLAKDYGASIEVLHIIPPKDPLSPEVRDDTYRAMDTAIARAKDALGDR